MTISVKCVICLGLATVMSVGIYLLTLGHSQHQHAIVQRDYTFPSKALLKNAAGDFVQVPVWVKAVRDKDRAGSFEAVGWSYAKPPDCTELPADAHYKTSYPMALMPGPDGVMAAIVVFEGDAEHEP